MNKQKRKTLESAKSLLDKASDIVSNIKDQEEDSLNNMPENLRESERCENMESIVDDLDDIITQIEDIKDSIDNVIDS